MRLATCLLAFVALALGRVPTIDDLLNLKSIGGAVISPDGQYVAYTWIMRTISVPSAGPTRLMLAVVE